MAPGPSRGPPGTPRRPHFLDFGTLGQPILRRFWLIFGAPGEPAGLSTKNIIDNLNVLGKTAGPRTTSDLSKLTHFINTFTQEATKGLKGAQTTGGSTLGGDGAAGAITYQFVRYS